MKTILKRAALASALMGVAPVYATNGYFLPGFGVKSQGAGGVGIAVQADALSQVANPANATQTGMRGDLGLTLFNPERKSSTGSATGLGPAGPMFNTGSESGNTLYLMPDMAFTMPLSERLSVGFAMVGNGGMNTTYKENIFGSAAFGEVPNGMPDDNLGIDLMQIIAPVTVAYKLNDQHSVGASLNLAAQRFKANGLGQFVFFGISSDSDHLTNNGYDYSYGAGIRLGWLGKFMDDRVSLGATWASRTYMTKFDKYRGLFAEQGDFDIPENYGIGLSVKATDKFTVAADVIKIKYSDVASIGNPGPGIVGGSGYDNFEVFAAATNFVGVPQPYSLGNDEGMGFGWKDMTVYKLGFIYDVNEDLALRFGYNYGKTPVRNDQLVFSALAPGIVERHYSVGFTKKMKGELDWELSGTYMYVANNTQEGCGQAVVDCVSFSMHQHVLGVGFGVQY